VDIFDRERIFIDRILMPLLQQFPGLRVVLEHITTKEAVHFIKASGNHVGATITAHHLLLNRNAIFSGGIKPHHYCLPILKREEHRLALIEAISSGSPKFFLGTDSAPHAKGDKESACGCAGIYTSHAAIELYAEAFAAANVLDRLDAFASVHGALFYGLPRNQESITLVQESWQVPKEFSFGISTLVPLRAGGTVNWKLI
jgi:dihydroorotase